MLQLSQRPLTGSDADYALFTNRHGELKHLEQAALLDFNVLLLGERGSGITSVMHQHLRRLRELGRNAFYVSAVRAESLDEVLDAIRIGVLGRREGYPVEVPGEPDMDFVMGRHRTPMTASRTVHIPGDPDPLATLRYVGGRLLEAEESSERAIVLLDDVRDPALIHSLFGRHRDEVWEIPIRWVVGGQSSRRSRYLEAPADAFFDTEITLDPLTDAASEHLVSTRLRDAAQADADAADRIRTQLTEIIERGGGNPRRLLAAARDATLRTPDETAATDVVIAAAETLGISELAAVRHLHTHGPTSASDPELLEELGIGRARATQVFRHLEEEGLVVATHEKGGVGRPRKMYAIKTSIEEPVT
ncbi:MAG: hypothetical protein M5U23_03430 [Acidimicrobiia bacterium]|nr:hypothetical protein [Acidimicrobiia bacterium]